MVYKSRTGQEFLSDPLQQAGAVTLLPAQPGSLQRPRLLGKNGFIYFYLQQQFCQLWETG